MRTKTLATMTIDAANLLPTTQEWLSAAGFVLPLLMATVLAVFLALTAWRHRNRPGGLQLTLLMSGATAWALFYAIELATPALPAKTLWAQLQYIGIGVIPGAWLMFTRSYTGSTQALRPLIRGLIVAVPVVTLMLVMTNDNHHLMWRSVTEQGERGIPGLVVEHGPWFWVNTAYSYSLLAIGSYILGSSVYRYPDRYQRRAGLLLLATAVPWLSNVLFLAGVRPAGNVDLTPLSFTFTGLILAVDISRLNLFHLLPALLPTAHGQLMEKMKDGVLVVDQEGMVVMTNPAATDMLRLSEDAVRSTPFAELLGFSPGTSAESTEGSESEGQMEITLGESPPQRIYDVVWSPLKLRGRIGMGRLVVLRDISERKQAEQVLRESEKRYRSLFDNAHDLVFSLDSAGRFTSLNEAVTRALGYSRQELLGRPVRDLIDEPEFRRVGQVINAAALDSERAMLETALRAKDGRRVRLEASIHLVKDETRLTGVQCISRDVTEQRLWEEALRHQALHDGTTGLPNRSFFRERLHQVVTNPALSRQRYALLVLDLDGFKEVNDALGHHCGDALLRQVGYRLQKSMRTADIVARLGGDEFALLVQVEDAAHGCRAALRVLDTLLPVYEVEGQSLRVSASVGIAMYPENGTDADSLLRYADIAMYMAKHAGGGRYASYSADLDTSTPNGTAIQCELRAALDRDELTLFYQPQLECHHGTVIAAEALVRWQHPHRGLILPAQFIGLAEQDGLIGHLTSWVLGSALNQCALWRREHKPARVAVNLSARDLDDPDFPTAVEKIIHSCRADPTWLTVEITESSIVIDPVRTSAALMALRDLGISIAVDDFGAGHTSLTHLTRLPIDTLKIDKSFVMNMTIDKNDAAIVRSTIGLAHDLGMTVVAEGVENAATLELLKALGCDIAQGNYLGRPMPARAAGARFANLATTDTEEEAENGSSAAEGQRLRCRIP